MISWVLILCLICISSAYGTYEASQYRNHHSYVGVSAAMARMRKMQQLQQQHVSQAGGPRKLLQASTAYPSNSAPEGSKTGSGLVIYTPVNCSYLDSDDFSQFLYDNYNDNNSKGVYLSAGNYTVDTSQEWRVFLLYIDCFSNQNRRTTFEINMVGSTLYVGNRDRAAAGFDYCSNVIFKGAKLTYARDQQVFTQGTLTQVGDGNWTMQVDQGYPTDVLLYPGREILAIGYQPETGYVKQNGTEFNVEFSNIGNDTFTFPGPYLPGFYVGMKLAIRGDTGAFHMTVCNFCQNFRMLDTTIWSSNIFGVLEYYSYNSTYNNVQIVPDPTDRQRPQPLLSANADGIHSVLPSYGPQITNCRILNTGDDNIAVHGNYYVVAAVNATGLTARRNVTFVSFNCDDPSCLSVKVGGRMLLYNKDLQSLGFAVIKSINTVPQPRGVSGYSGNYPTVNYDEGYYFSATVTSWPTNWTTLAGFESVITNPASNGVFANIVNNTVGNNRARGIFHKGSNSIIQNNNVTGSTAVGIFVSPDYWFLEADFSQNLTIRSNYVNVTNVGIFVSSLNYTLLPAMYQNHKVITITGNTVSGSQHPLVVGSAISVTATSNTIKDSCCYPYLWGDIFDQQGNNINKLVYISYTNSSSFSSNAFSTSSKTCRQYGDYKNPYFRGPGLTNVSIK